MRRYRSLWLLALLVGCAEPGEVNLGSDRPNGDAPSSFEGIAEPGQLMGGAGSFEAPRVTLPNLATLYEGSSIVHHIAVNESRLVATFLDPLSGAEQIAVCDLPGCVDGFRPIHRVIDPDVALGRVRDLWTRTDKLPISALILSHDEVIWSETGIWEREQRSGQRILSVPASGGLGDVQLFASFATQSIAADASYVYWVRDSASPVISRRRRDGSSDVERKVLPSFIETMINSGNAQKSIFFDERHQVLFFSGGVGIAKISPDFALEPTIFYQDTVAIQGLVFTDEAVFFPVSGLVGSIRRCSYDGVCVNATKLTDAPNWPRSLVTDGRVAYWQERALDGQMLSSNEQLAISSSLLKDGELRVQVATNIGYAASVCGLAMNQTHLFFCERQPNANTAIRMKAK